MAQDGMVTFDCTVGDFHAGTTEAVQAFSVSWDSLLLRKLRYLLCIEEGYSYRPTVLFVSQSPENQVDQGPCHHMVPIVVARRSWLVTRHKYPIVHSPSKAFEAVDVSKVHLWVCVYQHVALLFLASTPLLASVRCYLKNLICHHALRIEIVCPQLLEDKSSSSTYISMHRQ